MANKQITVIGGTGFVGKAVVNALLRKGYDVQAVSRNAQSHRDLFPLNASGGRLLLKNADVSQPKTLHGLFDDSFAVINLVGILFEKGRQRFPAIHSQCAERIAKMAKEAGVGRFIHLSALGVNTAKGSRYASSKATGETAVLAAFPSATILAPSVIFGPEDNFINQFSQMAAMAPALPLIGGGKTRFQPVYVGDLAAAVVKSLEMSETKGKRYELGGPNIYSFKEILELILRVTHRKRCLISVPWGIAKIMGFFAEFLPVPPITRDQVQLLKFGNVVNENGFEALDIVPQSLEIIIPQYLAVKAPAILPQEA